MGDTTNMRDLMGVIKIQINQLNVDQRLIGVCIHPKFETRKEREDEINKINSVIKMQEEIYYGLLKIDYDENY